MGNKGVSLLVFFILVLTISTLISASTSFFVPKDSNYSLEFNCNIDDAICSDNSNCSVTLNYPNSTEIIRNEQADNLGNAIYEYNITYNYTDVVGEYDLNIVCFDGSVNGSQKIIYEVNPSGIRNTQQRTDAISRSIYIMFIIGVLLFVAFLFSKQVVPVKWTYFIFSIIFFLIAINLLFVSLQDEIVNPRLETFFSSFTMISWYFYWFAGGILIIMWFFTFFQTYLLKKNLDNMRRYGMS